MSGKSNVDLVLVNPGNRSQIYQVLGSTLAAIEPPVWAALMAMFVRQKGVSVQIIDATAEDLTHEQTADRILEIKPTLTAIVVYGQQPSASTQVMPGAGAVASALRRKASAMPIIMLGGHAAALPERTLREEAADFVASGEGLYTLVDLIEALKAGSPDFSKVRGLYYKDGDMIRATPPAPLVQNLDQEMPGLVWDLLPMDLYRAHNWHCFDGLNRKPYAALYTTLGCPFHCSFCCIQAPFKDGEHVLGLKASVNSYRFWSPEAVIKQIDILVNQYGVRNIKFADEMFVLNSRHILGIADLIIERGYDLNIWAYARVDTVKDNMLDKLKQAGFHWLAFGIEAASARVRDQVQKGVSQDDIYRTIKRVREAGIYVIGNYIFGLPEDDLATMQETLDMAIELNCEFANFYSAMAYPGSELYRMAQAEGWALPEKWSGYSQHSVDTLPLPTNYLKASEVLRFRDHAFQAYFANPRYLDMIERKFGAETRAHILEMTSFRLERNYS